jgi:ABC-2 type transport system permease protein
MVFVVPIGYAVLLGSVYLSGVLTEIPMGVVDLDNSVLSREVVSAFANSPKFRITENPTSYEQLRTNMEEGRVRAGIVIPAGFESDASLNQGTKILTVYDASNLIWGYNIRKNALEVISKFNIDKTAAYLMGLGMDESAIVDTLDAVSTNFQIWYNPNLSYATFICLGLMLMIIHQIGLLATAISVTREKEQNSWLNYLAASIPPWKVFLGKSIPYFIVNMFNYMLLLLVASEILKVKLVGHTCLLLLFGIVYNVIITSAGFLISVYARDSLQVTRYLMLLSTPFFLISGFTWPNAYIPEWVKCIARITPFSWMAESMRRVTVKNLGFDYVRAHFLALCLMGILCILLCVGFSKRRKLPTS